MLEGNLKDFSIYEILQIISLGKKTGKLALTETDNGDRGAIYFEKGQVKHAEAQGYAGETAVLNILRATGKSFKFTACSVDDVKQTISKSVPELILFATSRLDEWKRIEDKVHSVNSIFRLSSNDIPDEIHLTPIQWRLIFLFGKELTIREVALRLKMPEIDVSREVYSLVTLRILREVGEKSSDMRGEKTHLHGFIVRLIEKVKRYDKAI